MCERERESGWVCACVELDTKRVLEGGEKSTISDYRAQEALVSVSVAEPMEKIADCFLLFFRSIGAFRTCMTQ